MSTDAFFIRLTVEPDNDGERIDRLVVRRLPDASRSSIQKLITSGEITVNDAVVRPSHRVRADDDVVINIPDQEDEESELAPYDLEIPVAYEDDDVIVFNKPPGLVVHPSPGHKRDTLVNAFRWMRPDAVDNGTDRPGVVQRLDKDTSGLIVLAKNERARLDLLKQWQSRSVVKGYDALVIGQLPEAEAIVDAPIGRDPHNRKRMAVVANGREAISRLETAATYTGYSLLNVRIETGRTHQIRVHCAFTGHPVAGDVLYGGESPDLPLERQFLHASYLVFRLPDGKTLELRSPLPTDLRTVLEYLSARS